MRQSIAERQAIYRKKGLVPLFQPRYFFHKYLNIVRRAGNYTSNFSSLHSSFNRTMLADEQDSCYTQANFKIRFSRRWRMNNLDKTARTIASIICIASVFLYYWLKEGKIADAVAPTILAFCVMRLVSSFIHKKKSK